MGDANPFESEGLARGAANHVPLTPLSFLPRAAAVYPQRCAVIHGDTRHVAVMAPNIPGLLEAHYGVPMAGRCSTP
jgi:fatty-acyl-CoA synthase